MSAASLSGLARAFRRPLVASTAGLLLAAAVGLAAWSAYRWLRPDPLPHLGEPSAAVEDPRLTFATDFLNVRPEVRYVGDGSCVRCHAQGATYPRHPMGRSLAPAASDKTPDDRASRNPFDWFGFRFQVERRSGEVFHSATRRSADGSALYDVANRVDFAVGSGTNGRSFLVNHDGYLFQSPITWFPRSSRWDVSPGYAATTLFDRPIKPGCLFCHCNEARPVANTINRYEEPIFRGHAIGCERCHGPAEIHLRDREKGPPADLPDRTIVNPARLAHYLRDAVCEQCHLQGEARVLRRGREAFDYRPGLPLHLFWSVFVRPPELADGMKFVGHVEQMRASRCWSKSDGELGCVSCHDPHRLPEPAERVAYYRKRCQHCHERKPCVRQAVPAGQKNHQSHVDNDCVACHVPRRKDVEIMHTTVADHRVLRRPDEEAAKGVQARAGEIPLVLFHKDLEGGSGPEVRRDLGLAVIDTAQRQALPPQARAVVGRLAQPLLDEAVERAADDVAAREARGLAFAMQGNPRRALADFKAVLDRAPRREASLVAAADTAMALKDFALAESYWRHALEANPWTARSRARLAEALAQQEKWPAALKECQSALRLNPAREVRRLLVTALLRTGDRTRAEAEFNTLLAERPDEKASLREWWAEQTR